MQTSGHVGKVQKSRKEKVVVVFRLAVTAERRVAGIPGAGEVGAAYAMRSLVKEGRAKAIAVTGKT